MNASQPDNETIFHTARDIAHPERRREYVREACGGDEARIAHVQAMLTAADGPDSLLDHPAAGTPLGTIQLSTTELPATVIGPYKLIEQIGEGGMGTVWMARQTDPVKRLVAVKVIKPGMDSRQVIARFEAERQALALMDHPNIARVFDAGTTDSGRPYFVMELVKGLALTKYCDEHRLTPKERLELFIPVCQAIQHAHQKGIIHRDVKPSNVLVAHYDGKPVPKVIDFGVAKATGQQLTEHTLVTGFGDVVGTLEYMSPEQAEVNQLDIDTRSDIYSLGVLLYELLTGTTPLDRKRLKQAAVLEMLRMIREEEPPKPSTRLSDSKDSLASISAQRHTEPAKLTRLVHGELDWIVMKALEKDRNRRYETANGLARDIEHYLNDEAVQACPPSAGYRFRKFARRNRATLWTTGVVALALVLGTVVSAWEAVRAMRAEALAADRLDAESQARREADTNFAAARQAVNEYFTVVSGSPLLDAPGLEPLRKQMLDTALRYNREFIQQHREDPNLQADVAASHIRVAEITYLVGGSNDQWFPQLRAGTDIVSRLIQERRDTPEIQQRLAKIHLNIGDVTGEVGSVSGREVLQCLEKLAHCWEKFVRDNPDSAELRNSLAGIYFYLASTGAVAGPKLNWADKAAHIWEKLATENSQVASYRMDLAKLYEGRAPVLRRAGRLEQADQDSQMALRLRQDLTRDFPGRASHIAWLAISYRTAGELQSARNQFGQAEKSLRSALELQQKLVVDFPSAHAYQDDLAKTQQDLGPVLQNLGNSKAADTAFREALSIWERLAIHFPNSAAYRNAYLQAARRLAQFLQSVNQAHEGASIVQAAVGVYQKLVDTTPGSVEDQIALAGNYESLARFLSDLGQPQEIENAYRKNIEIWQKLAADHPQTPKYGTELARSHNRLGILLRNAGRTQDAASELRKAQAYWRAQPDPGVESARKAVEADPQEKTGSHWHDLGVAYYRAGDWEGVVEVFSQKGGSPWEWFYLAIAHGQLDHQDEARWWYYCSLDWMAREREKRLLDVQAEAAEVLGLPDPKDRLEQALGLSEKATVYGGQGQPEKAKEAYGKAIELYESLAKDFPAVLAYRAKLFDLLTKTGRQQEADKVFASTAAFLEKLPVGSESGLEYRRAAAQWWYQWGVCLKEAQRAKEAEPIFRRAIALWEKLAADVPKDPNYLNWIGQGFWRLSEVCSVLHRPKDMEDAYRHIIAVYEKLAGEFPQSPNYRVEVGHCLWRLAEVCAATRRPKEVEDAYRKALTVFEKLAADFPQEPYYLLEAAHTCSAQLGPFLLRQPQRIKDAEEVYRHGLVVHKKLVADFPTRADESSRRLASNYNALANLLNADGRAQEADDIYRQEIEFWTKLAAANPNEPNLRNALATARENQAVRQARDYIRSSQWNKAAAEYAQANLQGRPVGDDAFGYACLFLIQGDSQGYERFCQVLVQRAGKSEDPFEAFSLARACSMASKSPVDPARAVAWGKKAVARDQPPWYFHALGMAQYRAGQFDQALQSFAKADIKEWAYRDINCFGLALVHHSLGHPDEARKCLDKGVQWLERYGSPGPDKPTSIHPSEWAEAQVLRREVEEKLKIKRSP